MTREALPRQTATQFTCAAPDCEETGIWVVGITSLTPVPIRDGAVLRVERFLCAEHYAEAASSPHPEWFQAMIDDARETIAR